MLETSYLILFLTGLLGGGHCLGMCSGIVTALSLNLPAGRRRWPLMLAYNLGRVGSYVLSGALLGGLAEAGLSLLDFRPLQTGLYVVASVLMIALGLYLAGLSAAVTRIEHLGRPVWRHIQPRLGRLLPLRSTWQALLAGAAWGWIPCGLVYTASLSALATGSAVGGALCMLAFGAGTLPNLLAMGALADRLRMVMQKRPVRLMAGLAVIAMGVWQLWRVSVS